MNEQARWIKIRARIYNHALVVMVPYKKRGESSDSPVVDTDQPAGSGEGRYVAFKACSSPLPRKLRVRCHGKTLVNGAFSWNYNTHITYSRTALALAIHFPAAQTTIKILGRNLHPLVDKLIAEEVEWIEEYDPTIWGPVVAEDDPLPLITTIVIMTGAFKEEYRINLPTDSDPLH